MMSFQKIYSPTQLANAMKLVRQQNGWTQSELAKKIGIKQATISNFENNPDNTTLTTFFKILQSLELSTSPYLFRLAAVIDSRHFTTSFQHFRSLAVREYTSAISNWQRC